MKIQAFKGFMKFTLVSRRVAIGKYQRPKEFKTVYIYNINLKGHIATVRACSSGTLTNVLPHRNVMPQTQNMTPHPVPV